MKTLHLTLLIALINLVMVKSQESEHMNNKNGFKITGTITNANGKKVYVAHDVASSKMGVPAKLIILDSCIIRNNSFILRGHVSEPNFYFIYVQNKKGATNFILDNANLKYYANANLLTDGRITGPVDQEIALRDSIRFAVQAIGKGSGDLFTDFLYESTVHDSTKIKAIQSQLDSISRQTVKVEIGFVERNPDALRSLILFSEIYKQIDRKYAQEIFNGLSLRLRHLTTGKKIKSELF